MTNLERKAMEMALEALEKARTDAGTQTPVYPWDGWQLWVDRAITELRQALDKPEIDQQALVQMAVLAEREACAKLCDHWPYGRDDLWSLGQAIRARGEK